MRREKRKINFSHYCVKRLVLSQFIFLVEVLVIVFYVLLGLFLVVFCLETRLCCIFFPYAI